MAEPIKEHYNKAVEKRPKPERAEALFQTPDADRFYHFYTKGPEAYKAINLDEGGQENHSLGWSKEDGLRWISAELEASPELREVPDAEPHLEFVELVDKVLGIRGIPEGVIRREFMEATGKTPVMAKRFLNCLKHGVENAAEIELIDSGARKVNLEGQQFKTTVGIIQGFFDAAVEHQDLKKYRGYVPKKKSQEPLPKKPTMDKWGLSKKEKSYYGKEKASAPAKEYKPVKRTEPVEKKIAESLEDLPGHLQSDLVAKARGFMALGGSSNEPVVQVLIEAIAFKGAGLDHSRKIALEVIEKAKKKK